MMLTFDVVWGLAWLHKSAFRKYPSPVNDILGCDVSINAHDVVQKCGHLPTQPLDASTMRLSVPNSSATYLTNVVRTSRSDLAGDVAVSSDHSEEVDMDIEEEMDESLVVSDGDEGEISTEPSLTSEDAEIDHSPEGNQIDETGNSADLPQPNDAHSEVEAEMEEEEDESDGDASDDEDDDDEGDEQYSVSLLDDTQHGDDDIHILTTIPLR